MPRPRLPEDATAITISDTVDNPEEYIRGMLANLHESIKIEKDSQVTIGVTGQGKVPNYKIDVPNFTIKLFEQLDPVTIHKPIRVFSGRTHKQIYDPSQVQHENWSRKSTTLEELKQKLGDIRRMRDSRRLQNARP